VNSDHVDYIVKDLHKRGIVLDEFQDEVIDHVCSAVAAKMSEGRKFKDAYDEVIRSFGDTSGLNNTQEQVIQTNRTVMFKSYFKIALRNHLKQRFYTAINIGGLAIGVASCLIIGLFVIRELSFDRQFPDSERVYRVNSEIKFGSNHFHLASVSAGFADVVNQEYPEVEAWTRVRRQGFKFIRSADQTDALKEKNVMWVDSLFFKVFKATIVEGDPNTALTELNSIAISKSIADKYFPGESALGKSLLFTNYMDDLTDFKITAVFEDFPANTHFHPSILGSTTGNPEAKSASLVGGSDFNMYLLLQEGTDPANLESKFVNLVDKYVAPQIGAIVGGDFTMEKFRASGQKWEYTVTPVVDIHLHSDRTAELESNGSMTYVTLLSSIGLLILCIACVNFINLSTARSSNRAKEVGVRKVMGSMRSHLVRQFLVESTLLTLVAFILSVGVAQLMLPYFNELAVQPQGQSNFVANPEHLSIPFGDIRFYGIMLATALVIGVAAGLYPSFFLAAFKPVKVLKGNSTPGMRTGFVRSSLVVFQFTISIFLIIGTIVIQRQLNYIQQKELGFNKDQVLVIRDVYQLGRNLLSYKEEMLANSFVQSGTMSGYLPVSNSWRDRDAYWPEGVQRNMDQLVSLQSFEVADDYIPTLGMTMTEGRNFNKQIASDSAGVLLNEAAVRTLGFGDEPLGRKILGINGKKPDGTPDPNNTRAWTVIGVVKNFHFESMKDAIEPVAFFLRPSYGYFALRFDPAHTDDLLKAAEQSWKKIAPSSPFQYSFLDEDFEKMYNSEKRLGKIFTTFSGLAIVIACLGLFGLSAFTAEQRTKEIGIRKVLGASVPGIVVLLSKEFGKLVIIAYVIAAPAAWYSTGWWLQGYSYKTEIGIFVYMLAGIMAFIVAWLTMSYQSIKAAVANPVKSLRSE
jgi:putative ABC transport system permease protein